MFMVHVAQLQYDHVLEMLLAIHPSYKDVDDQSVHVLLPLAFDYQVSFLILVFFGAIFALT